MKRRESFVTKLDDLFVIARSGAIELLTHEEESAVSLSDKCEKV